MHRYGGGIPPNFLVVRDMIGSLKPKFPDILSTFVTVKQQGNQATPRHIRQWWTKLLEDAVDIWGVFQHGRLTSRYVKVFIYVTVFMFDFIHVENTNFSYPAKPQPLKSSNFCD